MNKVLGRASVVLASAVLAVPLWGVPTATADQTVLAPSSSGYFNSDGIRKPDQSPAAPPNVTSTVADGVAADHLAVAARGGSENKVSFLLFDLLDLDPAATISKAVLTVPVAPDGGGNVNIAPAPEKVVACMAGPEGFGGDDGNSTVDAPARLCDKFSVAAVATADGAAYAFDLTALAQTWLTAQNDGVALTSAPAARSTAFQRVFKPAPEAKLAVSFTAPPASTTLPTLPSDVSTSSGTGTSSGTDLSGSFDSGSVTAPDAGVAVSEPLVSADVPVSAPDGPAPVEPAVAAPGVATVPVSNAMQTSLTPPVSFWVGLLLLAGLLALLSLILGDAAVARASASRTSRLTQALQARQRTTSGGSGSARPALNL